MTPLRVVFDTNLGPYTFVWRARETVELFYPDEDTPRETINVWDEKADAAVIKRETHALATFGQDWLWERERGIQIDSAQGFVLLDLEPDRVD